MEKSSRELLQDLYSWRASRRRAAAEALARRADPDVVEPLVGMIGPTAVDYGRRGAHALCAILRSTTDRAMPIKALGALDPTVNARSAGFLSIMAKPHTAAAVQVERVAVQALVRLQRPLAGPLIRALKRYHWGIGASYWVREAAGAPATADSVAFLAEEAAVPPIVGMLALPRGLPLGRRRTARCDVVRGWVELAPHTVAPLFRLLAQPDLCARLWAAEALGRIGGGEVIQRLLPHLDTGDSDERLAGAVAIGHAGDSRAVALLSRSLDSEDTDRLLAVTSALCHTGAQGAPALGRLRALANYATDPEVRSLAEEAIRRIERALRTAPAELEAAAAPEGTGTELEATDTPQGRGTELEASPAPDARPVTGDERP